jgi:hypothetical protein
VVHWIWPRYSRSQVEVQGRHHLTMGDFNAPHWRGNGGQSLAAVQVAAPAPAVGLGPELPLKLHQAPDAGAVRAHIRLNRGGHLLDGGQVDAEQLGASLQWRRDRPAQARVVPGPHPTRVSNTSSRPNREYCLLPERPLGHSERIVKLAAPLDD